MSREYLIVWAGRHRRDHFESLCAGYRERIVRALSHTIAVRDLPVRSRRGGEDDARRRAEGEAQLAVLPDPCWTIALDSRGKTLSSPQLARELVRLREEWPHPVAFLLGSDLGLDDAVLAGARRVLSFGPMTLSHELARLVLYEQLYRALDIAAGGKYHK